MAIHDLQLLQRVIFGEDSIDRLGMCVRDSSARTILVVTDEGVRSAGYLDRALTSLRKASLDAYVFDTVPQNPTTDDIETGVLFARECPPIDLIVGLGGGSPMDCAKGINFVLTNGGRLVDYPGFNRFKVPLLPAIGIPTTAGTGSEAQSYAVVAHTDTRQKQAYGSRDARFRSVVLDPKLCLSMPMRLTAICGIDAVSHVLESYVSTRRSAISQMLARESWKRIYASFERVLKNPQNLNARGEMLWGAHFAGAAIENSMLGAAHATANPVTARFGVTHGIAVGLMLPHVLKTNAPACGDLYSELIRSSGVDDDTQAADLLIDWLQNIKEMAGLPLRLRDCGVDRGVLPTLAREAAEQWTGRFNPRPVGEDEFLELYEGAF